jgi:lipopolysaccharide transport system permease protein
MFADLRVLFRYRDLLWLWSWRQIRSRYKQSLLGMLWAILQPIVMMVVFTVVFSRLIGVDTGDVPYPIFTYSALVPWTFFATSLTVGIPSLINNMNLVTKIYFPREILPIAAIVAAFLDFLLASIVLVGLMVFYNEIPGIGVLWVIPLLVLQILLTIGVVLLGAMIIVFVRDMRFVVPMLVTVWMYACPIVYPVDLVPEQWAKFYFLNPMAGIIDGYRRAVLEGAPPRIEAIALGTITTMILLIFAYFSFKRSEHYFADVI